jgi:transcriptional regulator with XRE-family HTH domain
MFVNNLKHLIEEYKSKHRRPDGTPYTQSDIATMAKVDPATLSRYVNDQINSVNIEIWQKLADFFGVPGEAIFAVKPGKSFNRGKRNG